MSELSIAHDSVGTPWREAKAPDIEAGRTTGMLRSCSLQSQLFQLSDSDMSREPIGL